MIASPRILALAASLVVLLASPARAQWLDLGAKGGVNLATQQIGGTGSGPAPQPRIGLVAGVFGTRPLAAWIDVQIEALFAMRGTKITVGSLTTSEEIDYLDVPLLARVKKRLGKWKVYAAAGPSAGFKLRARTRTSFSGSTEEIDIGNQVETLDLGVAMGGGVERGSLVIDARYTLGFSNIDKDKTDATKTTNRTLAVTVGYRFHP